MSRLTPLEGRTNAKLIVRDDLRALIDYDYEDDYLTIEDSVLDLYVLEILGMTDAAFALGRDGRAMSSHGVKKIGFCAMVNVVLFVRQQRRSSDRGNLLVNGIGVLEMRATAVAEQDPERAEELRDGIAFLERQLVAIETMLQSMVDTFGSPDKIQAVTATAHNRRLVDEILDQYDTLVDQAVEALEDLLE
ncbi:hypothetical protein B0T24DRAFT_684180 [Lasiosphaeria ovina]|uniref:Uncharacterized protein n=1 Tax=Lasiosphaeria ovina TaxID=92902 RepID=A0AAE0JV04_9PEZI|nr:hypothetical protein B0T24DRAFT_684180 [Lasiosphaeria ovina]